MKIKYPKHPKVKFISTEEAANLKSGTPTETQIERVNLVLRRQALSEPVTGLSDYDFLPTDNASSTSPASRKQAIHGISEIQSSEKPQGADVPESNLALLVNVASSVDLVGNSEFGVSKDLKQRNPGSSQGKGKEIACLQNPRASGGLVIRLKSGIKTAKQNGRAFRGCKRSQVRINPAGCSKTLPPTENANSCLPAKPKRRYFRKSKSSIDNGDGPGSNPALDVNAASCSKKRIKVGSSDPSGVPSKRRRGKQKSKQDESSGSNPGKGKDILYPESCFPLGNQLALEKIQASRAGENLVHKSRPSAPTNSALVRSSDKGKGVTKKCRFAKKSRPGEAGSSRVKHSIDAGPKKLENQENFPTKIVVRFKSGAAEPKSPKNQENMSPKINCDVEPNNAKAQEKLPSKTVSGVDQMIVFDQQNFGADHPTNLKGQEQISPKIVSDQLNLGAISCNHESQEKFSSNIASALLNFGGNFRNPESQENIATIIFYNPNAPTLKRVWKGCFEIHDLVKLRGFTPDIRLCEGISAHPAATMTDQAYDFAKQIAEVMHFKLYPRYDVCRGIFKTSVPDSSHISLYFYPSNTESSKRKYSTLLKYLEKHDMVMISRMGPVELVVLASTLLPNDSQKLEGSFFMWGIFRCLIC